VTYRPSHAPAVPASGAPASRVVGVKRLADYLKRKLESDAALRNVSVRGEISNYSVPRSGHVNFDLKEGDAVIRCFAWSSDAASFPPLRNGIAIVATGGISTYAPKSTYQLVVRSAVLEGVGDIHAQFEERKKRLDAEGLFDPARKRTLPLYPFRVAIVSSRTSDGAIDFVTILRERAPHVRVVWCETAVQGPSAPVEICGALRRASAEDVDCIVVTRGGGSFEDLFAFSDEAVVRAVAKARHPVISAIGHTANQQLSDFAADVHVETPSAAAKAIGFETRALRGRIEDRMSYARRALDSCLERLSSRLHAALLRSRLSDPRSFLAPLAQRLDALEDDLQSGLAARTASMSNRVRDLTKRLEAHDPTRRLAERELHLDRMSGRLDAAMTRAANLARERLRDSELRLDRAVRTLVVERARALELACVRLDGNSPERLLQQGYAILTYGTSIVRDAAQVPVGEIVTAQLGRGTLSARVERAEMPGVIGGHAAPMPGVIGGHAAPMSENLGSLDGN
jgi:exodeoxyribonuclease VII large subunit